MRGGIAGIGQASDADSTPARTAGVRFGGTAHTATIAALPVATDRPDQSGPAPPPRWPDEDDEAPSPRA